MNLRKFLILQILLIGVMTMHAQTAANISGHVTDEKGEALQGVVVSWLTLPDSTFVTNSISTADGQFSLKAPAATVTDSSVVIATCIGYEPSRIMITDKASHELVIVMKETAHTLKEVTVTERSTMNGIPGGLAFQPKGVDLLLNNGYELLRNVPTLRVRGNSVQLIGKSGVTIYLNGRNPRMSNSMILEMLHVAKPSDIERVELIFNPGSSLAASDQTGIVNIVMRRRPDIGFRGNVYGTGRYDRNKWSGDGGANLFYSHNRFRAGLSAYEETGDGKTTTETRYDYLSMDRHISESSTERERSISANISMSANYDLTSHSTLGLWASAKAKRTHNSISTTTLSDVNGNKTSYSSLLTDRSPMRWPGTVNSTLFYTLNTDSLGSNLDISLNYSWMRDPTRDTTTFENPYLLDEASTPYVQNTDVAMRAWQASAKYRQMFHDGSMLEYGLSFNTTRSSSDFLRADYDGHAFIRDDGQSNRFVYDETVTGAYATYRGRWGRIFSGMLGLRAEQTHTRGDQRTTGERFSRDYFHVFPNVSLTANMANGRHILGLDYSVFLFRPGYYLLNPFKVWRTPNYCATGNPDIPPTPSHSINLRYTLLRDYSVFIRYGLRKNTYTSYTVSDGQGHTISQWGKYGDKQSFSWSLDITKSLLRGRWRIMARPTLDYYIERGSINGVKADKNSTLFVLDTYNILYLGKNYDTSITLLYQYMGSKHEATKSEAARNIFMLYANKSFGWGGSISAQFSIELPQQETTSYATDTYRYWQRRHDVLQTFAITYTQRFGKQRVKEAQGHAGNSFYSRLNQR